MVRYQHTGGAVVTQLAAPIGSTDNSFTVNDGSGYPTGSVGPFWVVLGAGSANEEKVLCSARVDNVFTVASGGRGGDDTVAVPHSPPEQVRHIFTAREADEANAHINAESGVHGTSSEVVGRTDAQELRNKILNGAFNSFSNIPLSAVAGLATRLNMPYWLGYKISDNTIGPGTIGAPGTMSTIAASGITTPSGAHSSAKRVSKDGLYLITYRIRYGTESGTVEPGDLRIRLGKNPAGDGANTQESGTVIAEHQTRHTWRSDRERIHVRDSLSITISSGVTAEVYTLNLGATLPVVPHYVGVNLYSPTGTASGWNIRTDEYTTSTFRLIMDRHVATAAQVVVPIRIFALYGLGGAVIGHSVELSQVFRLNENDIIVFRVWNNGTDIPVTIHAGQEYSAASIVWLGP